jgi:hypothetical protein
MPVSPDQTNILMLDEVRSVCHAARAQELGGMSMYASQDHRRTMGWVLKVRKTLLKKFSR